MARELAIKITGDSRSLSRALGSANKDVSHFGRTASAGGRAARGLGLLAGGAAIGGVALLGKGLIDGVKTAIEHQKALAQTNAVIKSTGGGAKVSAAHILGLSDKIEKMTGIDDLATQAGANMLLTFTNIKNGAGKANKVFDQSVKVLGDMTTALGSDPQKQAIQLGKALNDPIKGISALSRVGVTFTAQQKENIKAMVEHGNVAGAQKLILQELQKEFGGSAEAAGKTMGGQLNILKAHLEDIEQVIGQKILPVLNQLIQWAITNWPTFQKYADIAMKAIQDAWVQYGEPALVAIRGAITTLVAWTRTNWDTISGIFRGAFQVIQGIVNIFIGIFKGDWDTFWNGIKQTVSGALDAVVGIVKLLGPFIVQALQTLGQRAVDALGKGLDALPEALKDGMKALPGLALAAAILVGKAIVAGVKWAVPHIIGLAGDLTGKIDDAINQVAGWALGAAKSIGISIADGVKAGISEAWDGVKSFFSTSVLDLIGSGKKAAKAHSPSQLTADEIGMPLAQGVLQGWLMGAAALPSAMSESLKNAIEHGRNVIQAARASFQAVWSRMASDADSAFSRIKDAALTPAEKKLAALQAGHEEASRNDALTSAQAELDKATAGGDPEAILSAQRQLAEAKYAIQVAALQKEAEAQRIQLDAKNALEQQNFNAALEKLQIHLAKGHASYAEAHAAIVKLFKSFGVNYADAGALLGTAFVKGLKNSIKEAAKKSGVLSGSLDNVAEGIQVPKLARGGIVTSPTLALIGESGPEAVMPLGGGMGGTTINVTVQGWVGDDQDIAERIRNTLIRTGRNTTGGALGRFA